MKENGEEVRRRFPRIVTSLVMALIFWVVSVYVPPTVPEVAIPGINTGADFLIWIVTIVIAATFLMRALSDALVLGDIVTDITVKRMGMSEEKTLRRAARDFIYIIIIILIATAVSPVLAAVKDLGHILTAGTTYIALGLIILLIYDIGRILYRLVEQKAELLSDRLVQMAEKNRK